MTSRRAAAYGRGPRDSLDRVRRRDDAAATALRIAHDVSLATWFGGAWMGAVGLNGATIEVDDHTQRTRVANAGWFRWAPIVAVAVATHLGAAAVLGCVRIPGVGARHGGPRRWTIVRTAVTTLAVLSTIETGVSGRRVVRGGDVPVASAVEPIDATPVEVAAAQRRLKRAQWMVPGFTAALWVINGLQDRHRA